MSTFDPDKISPSTERYLEREVAAALLAGARDYIHERVEQEARRGNVATYTFPGENTQQVALVKGQSPAPDEDTTVLIHNEVQHDENFPGDKLMVLSAWTISKTGIGFRQEVVYPHQEEEDVWSMPNHVPLIQNYAVDDEYDDNHGEVVAHLYMIDGAVDPMYVVANEAHQPTKTNVRFLLRACDVLRFSCTEATYNEYIQKLA